MVTDFKDDAIGLVWSHVTSPEVIEVTHMVILELYLRSLIGILRKAIELKQIDIVGSNAQKI